MELCNRIREALNACKENLQGQHSDSNNADYSERFLLTSPCTTQNNLKCVVALKSDVIYEADIKVMRLNTPPYKATIKEGSGSPYRLQQIQDCLNYTDLAINALEVVSRIGNLSEEGRVYNKTFLNNLFNNIRDARNVLTLPRRKSIEEHIANPSRKCFHPPVPKDVALSIFIRGHKLVFAAYLLIYNGNSRRWEISNRFNVECVIPWLNEVILLLSYAIETCLQLLAKLD